MYTAAGPTAVPRSYKCPLSPLVRVCVVCPPPHPPPAIEQQQQRSAARIPRLRRSGGANEKNVVP